MKRSTAVLVSALTVVAAALAGFGTWWFSRAEEPLPPQISAYSNGHLTRTGPYMYCNVLNLDECLLTEAQGTLAVDSRHPVQLSVDENIGRAPWQLWRLYDNPADTTKETYPAGSTLAVTVPTVDPQRGLLRGLVVQLPTLIVDARTGELFTASHAEWAVGTRWGRSDHH
ncbi:DUF2771 domain-containing protein [Mycolicibacter heraklionensis]|uniref:DUF2771 domain-containing protein n=1 Tax=Mycolicibacter heraklionensis TaxID=512402 RepID=A0AA91EUG7_9MYCO|nr:DUF2771 domain-containing protein [Mycolicibacter heraklionensis]OBK84887.1 hypothetical protein A5649_03755 [Mycolicibacter heraklionensis]